MFDWSTVLILGSQVLGALLMSAKPPPVVPPGQVGLYVLLPLTSALFLLSIRKSATAPDRPARAAGAAEQSHA